MGRKRFKTRRALLIVFLFTFIALAVIGVVARHPISIESNAALAQMRRESNIPGNLPAYGALDVADWVLPAIILVVSLGGISTWVVLIKANR